MYRLDQPKAYLPPSVIFALMTLPRMIGHWARYILRFLLFLVFSLSKSILGATTPQTIENELYICGIGTAWPSSVVTSHSFDQWVRSQYRANEPHIEKLLHINKKTGINARHVIALAEPAWQNSRAPPTVDHIDAVYRRHSLDLSVSACRKAIKEWGGSVAQITHTVAVTCTNSGSPGYDLEVLRGLDLSGDVETTLIHGVGCAGGLSALRTAARLLTAAGSRPANILVFACEITSIHVCPELASTEQLREFSIGPVLFGDGAAALILSNKVSRASPGNAPLYKLLGCTTMRIPGTTGLMSYYASRIGYALKLSRNVPEAAVHAMAPAFTRMQQALVATAQSRQSAWTTKLLGPSDFDWALHPGGLQILKGAELAMGLTHSHLRASYDVYRSKGNCSSVAVLAILDRLRELENGREHVLAMSFGPGLTVETAGLLRVSRVSHSAVA